MEDFLLFLQSKKIDPEKFKKGDPDRYAEFAKLHAVMHPTSLVAQKLFLINKIRRAYPFVDRQETTQAAPKAKMKPKITPKIK